MTTWRLIDGLMVACPVCGVEDLAFPTSWISATPHDLPHMNVTFLVKHRCTKPPRNEDPSDE